MKLTRRYLKAANTQLASQLAACAPESRQGLKRKLAATRAENDALRKQVEALKPASAPATSAAAS